MEATPIAPYRMRTAVLASLAAVLERCDEQMVPAVYRFIGAAFSATPTQLGYITLSRALVQALSAPIGGIAGHCLHRGRVVGCGCLLWSACTAAFATCNSLAAGAAIWGLNGLGLALVLPNAQSLIADLFIEAQRGRAFGLLYLTAAMGGMLGALYATNMGSHRPLGLDGWRFAFVSLAAVSGAAGVANLLLSEDPAKSRQSATPAEKLPVVDMDVEGGAAAGKLQQVQREGSVGASGTSEDKVVEDGANDGAELEPLHGRRAGDGSAADDFSSSAAMASINGTATSFHAGQQAVQSAPAPAPGMLASMSPRQLGSTMQRLRAAARPIAADIGAVLRIPTFIIIVLQGIMGSIPWSALVFLTLYLQLLGMSDAQASFLVALFLAGTAFGGLIGGIVGDAAAKRYPRHGRIAVTQFSVSIGIPFACLIFKGLPRSGTTHDVIIYAAVLLVFALLKAWPAPACNHPVFAEIVPPFRRNLVYAFDRCFEGAIAACAAPLVGVLAQRLFGYSGSGTVTHDRNLDLKNAEALGNALLAFLVVPWTFTLLLYTGLHWTYPADKEAALRQQRHMLRERAAPLEEQGVLIDRLSSGGDSTLSRDTEVSVEMIHHYNKPDQRHHHQPQPSHQLLDPGTPRPAVDEASHGGEEVELERLLNSGAEDSRGGS